MGEAAIIALMPKAAKTVWLRHPSAQPMPNTIPCRRPRDRPRLNTIRLSGPGASVMRMAAARKLATCPVSSNTGRPSRGSLSMHHSALWLNGAIPPGRPALGPGPMAMMTPRAGVPDRFQPGRRKSMLRLDLRGRVLHLQGQLTVGSILTAGQSHHSFTGTPLHRISRHRGIRCATSVYQR